MLRSSLSLDSLRRTSQLETQHACWCVLIRQLLQLLHLFRRPALAMMLWRLCHNTFSRRGMTYRGSLPSSVCDEFEEQKRQLGCAFVGALYPYGL